MTQTDQPIGNTDSLSPSARLTWLLLIIATLYFCYFHNLGVIGLVGPDEPRYAWIARNMAESGDWVTPRLYGQPWFEKPVLFYWGAALSFKLFGVTEAAARLPSAMAALLATLAVGWLARRTYGPETARWVALLLPATVGMIGFSHAAATDMPFAGMLTIAMVCCGLVLTGSGSTRLISAWRAGFGIFLGLAVLAKGPAAIVLSGGAVLFWAILTKRWPDALRCLHPVALVSFCVTALPWYLLCARRNPDFLRIFIIEHNFKRYLTPQFQHIQPFWFYIPVVLIAFLPWTLILIYGGVLGVRGIRGNAGIRPSTIFLLCWAGFCLLFFSLSKSKLPGYVLPAIPAIGLLLVRSFVVFSARSEKALRRLLTMYGLISLLAGVSLILIAKVFHASRTTGSVLIVVGCVVLAFALANVFLTLRTREIPFAAFCVIPVFLLIGLFRPLAHPWVTGDLSGKTLAAELAANRIPVNQIFTAGMKRGLLYSLSFYLHREVQPWNPDQRNSGFLLVPSPSCAGLVQAPLSCADHPIELRRSGWFVYRVERNDSGGGLEHLGSFGGNSNGNGGDRKPR